MNSFRETVNISMVTWQEIKGNVLGQVRVNIDLSCMTSNNDAS